MKRKTFFISVFIAFTILLLSTVVLAAVNNSQVQDKILTGEKISSVGESYKEVSTKARNYNNSNDIIDIANQKLEDINVSTKVFTNENSTIKNFSNNADSRQETVISNDKAIIKLNSNTGELISYINSDTNLVNNTLNDTEIKEKAIKIFNKINNIDKSNYEMTYVEKFDDEIWRAGFAKKYDGIINPGESIKFSFCPETEEIVTLSINKITYDNNQVVLTENDARNIAQPYLDKSIANNMSVSIEIVRPNYFYSEVSNDDSVYANIERTRKAYVCTFDNEAESKVYVDCTTGEVIGGDMITGGVY